MIYAITVFLSSFLLFQVQPIIAKTILPWFGGSASVWNVCMLFFQATLLGGYLYAHWLHEKLSGRGQALVHTGLLLGSIAALPILPSAAWKPSGLEDPSLRILGLLAVTVGLPYFALSSTSPLLQSWYARSKQGGAPYRLFALSNLASMLALLTYPFLVEPSLATRVQAYAWSAAFVGFALICSWTAWTAARATPVRAALPQCEEADAARPGWSIKALWLGLAGCASVLLLATTTFLTQDVAAIPLLWILPLAVYLLSFIIAFDAPRRYRRSLFLPLAAAALGGTAYLLSTTVPAKWMPAAIASLAAALFVCCMVCHGELARSKPPSRYLTGFYVMVSIGGAAGGLFVGFLAPRLFNAYYEFPFGLALCAALITAVILRDSAEWFRTGRRWVWRIALVSALGGYMVFLASAVLDQTSGCRLLARNFYGELRVRDEREPDEIPYRKLLHGLINHGQQMLDEKYRHEPVTYFCRETGIGRAMAVLGARGPIRAGILGLGCGTLLAYGRAGDTFRIYEINPMVVALAREEFTYLRDTQARVEVVPGDGRLSLEKEPAQRFDLLVMDAFSGDSVPMHLITREAFATYFRHLRPGGILAVNISNKYLDFRPVMERGASWFHKTALVFDYEPEDEDSLCFRASWALIVDAPNPMPQLFAAAQRVPPAPGFRVWTDDYSNLFRIFR
jgi:hypothetical protein